ncbi:hypothetical protein [Grimontia hollisae]|uniref:hypothetical protein n=1 Tax=Grimontia hollisae TaxID=673 RepID=UPI000DFF6218|nr:hypothetical protein [Grimontia hollisae]STQ75602.1 Uncharacterised protein [Grimontia hollisae]
MLLPYRTLLSLLLVVLLGWQGVAFAHHKGEHHHSVNIDHQCMLCALGVAGVETRALSVVPQPIGFTHPTHAILPFFSVIVVPQKARSPPNERITIGDLITN